MNDATAKIGRSPGEMRVDSLTLTLGGNSTGVISLDQVFAGDVNTVFVINDTNNTYDVGHVTNPTGVGPVAIDVNFDSTAVDVTDYQKMLSGSFKVVVRGNAAAGFSSKGASADLQMTFTFTAFQ